MADYLRTLTCSATGESVPLGRLHNLSPHGRPLLCGYDLDAIREDVDRDAFSRRARGMWRWRELLPLSDTERPVTLGEGDTPLLEARRLGAELDVRNLWVKDESVNPTGSFKARGLSAAVTMAAYLGAKRLIMPSAGNAGGALAAYAARAGLECDVFVPTDTPEINRLEVPLFGGRLHSVDGLIDECGRQVARRKDPLGAFDVSTLKEPYRLEGKKTLGLELAEQFGWSLPDVILYPTGGGTGLIGMAKAFRELAELGWLDEARFPRLVVVQSEGCAPMVRAFERGLDHAEPWTGAHTVASGLRVPAAVGDFLILAAVRASGGTAVQVAEEDLLVGMKALARQEGINAAPEAGACIAALRRLRTEGWIQRHERVVLFNTGAGTKYLEVLRSFVD